MDRREIFRYLRMPPDAASDGELAALIEDCIAEATTAVRPKGLYCLYPIEREGDRLTIGALCTDSAMARAALASYDKAALLALTLGAGADRLIRRYSSIQVARAAVLQAVFTELVENECRALEDRIRREHPGCTLGRRFSPGYGDLPLTEQTTVFRMLDLPRRIGVTLTDSLLMIPTKSVTALIGYQD